LATSNNFKELRIEITRRCNLNCYFCFDKTENTKSKKDYLKKEEIHKIIDKAANAGIPNLRITGGEPVLREELKDYLKHAKDSGLFVMLNTNATLLDNKKIHSLARYTDDVLISFHALDELTVNGKQNSNTKRKFNAINVFNDWNVFVRLATILQPENIPHIENAFKKIDNMNVQQWVLLRPIPNILNKDPLSESQLKEMIESLYKLKTKYKMPHLIENAIPFCSYKPELVSAVSFGAGNDDGRKGMVVDSRGKIKPDYFYSENLGNALETKFEDAWNTELMANIRNNAYLPQKCRSCTYLKACKGGSRFAAQYSGGKIDDLDPLARPDIYINKKDKQLIANQV